MQITNPLFLKDFYKADHRSQYPEGTTLVYSNFTPRISRIPGVDKVVFFGLQYFIEEYLIKQFDHFFHMPHKKVIASYQRMINHTLGRDAIKFDHIIALKKLGYLPIEIKALPEGSKVNLGVPMLTVQNTHPDFAWVTNFIETILSCVLWGPCTAATIAYEYRKLFERYAKQTCDNDHHVRYQGHDFSMRGMYGLEAAAMSGAGHLLSFVGTDTIPAIDFLEQYYGANITADLVGTSVYATEHSVMCAGTQEGEYETFRRLIEDVYPTGIVSIVSDTWDLWQVIGEYLPRLKSSIMAREGKVVIRPDSGDPADILCGMSCEQKGVIQLLWDIFGGTFNDKGYKVLDPHIGAIYGEAINLAKAHEILHKLAAKGFASSNIVFGIGSYTYQYNTRDTFGFAMKATYAEVNGQARELFKDPITDNGTKKSAKGLLAVHVTPEGFVLEEQVTKDVEECNALQLVYCDGNHIGTTFKYIRDRLHMMHP
jgi:nicotinamide phosphoribosyltransferase